LDKIENGEESKEREFHEKGNLDLNSVTDLVNIAGGCSAQNKNCLIWPVEDGGNLGKVEGVDNLGKVGENGNPGKVGENGNPGKVEGDDNLGKVRKNGNRGKVEEDDNLGKVQEDGNHGKVVDDDNPGKMEEDGSLGKDNLQVYKSEMMEKQLKNAYYHLPYH
jgi:hypothetical protein